MNDHTPPTDEPTLKPEPPGGPGVTRDLDAENVHCVDCGYNLRGLDPDGRCPECGAAIQRALAPHLLVNAGAAYVNDLHRGLGFVLCALIGQILLVALGIALLITLIGLGSTYGNTIPPWLPTAVESSLDVGSALLLIAGAVGWWLFSRPDPAAGRSDDLQTLRRLLRAAVVVNIGVQLFASATELVTLVPPALQGTLTMSLITWGVRALGGIAWITQFFATMKYIQALTPRLPDVKLLQRTRRDIWLLPLLFVVGFPCLGLGPLIAFVMYALLLLETRNRIAYVRTRQRVLLDAQ